MNLIVHVSNSLVQGGAFLSNISDATENVSFSVDIFGGYDSAEITLSLLEIDVYNWLEYGLGRLIDIYGETGKRCYKGFVNEVEIRIGRLALRRGPLLGSEGVVNRLWSVYSPMNTTTNPPTYGARTLTAATQDVDSQAKYGVIERVLSAGATTTLVADQIQAIYLDNAIRPKKSHDVGDSETPKVKLTLSGYYQWLEAVIYTQVAASGTIALSDAAAGKLQAVLTAARAVNSWCVSSDFTHITDNPILVPAYDSDDVTCLAALKPLIELGGASYWPWAFGLYGELVSYYSEIPQTIEYQAKVVSGGLEIYDMSGNPIPPYHVLPGKWVLFTDILPGRSVNPDLRDDPRALLIKRVEYTMPVGLTLNGMDANTLPQILAQYALGGI